MRAAAALGILLLATALPANPVSATSCSSGPANDCIASAIEWFGKPVWHNNVGATIQAGEPTACDGTTVTKSVWFHVEVVSPGSADMLGIQLDAPFYATLGLYTMGPGGALTQVSCMKSWEDEGLHSPAAFAPCTPGAIYWIQVGGQSGQSGSFSLTEWSHWTHDECWFKPTLPTEPRLYAPSAGNGQIGVSWVEPWWDGGRSVSVTAYKVYAAPACSGPFTHVGTTGFRHFTHTGLGVGVTRCYQVTAVNAVGEGPAEPGRSATTWNFPGAPTPIRAFASGDGQLIFSWQPTTDTGGAPMVSHKIYRSTSAYGPFSLVATAPAAQTSYSDAGLGQGVTYHYRVSAVNQVGEGPQSSTVAGTTWAVPGAPTGVAVRQVFSLDPIAYEITWQPPSGSAPFTHYRVYRATSPEGTATLIGEVTSSTTKLVDDGRLPFSDNHYEVRAYNPAGVGPASARACGVYPMESALGRCT